MNWIWKEKALSPKVDVLLKDNGDSFGIDTMSLIDVGVTKHPRKIRLLNSEITGETGNPEVRKGRLYRLTDKGNDLVKNLNEI